VGGIAIDTTGVFATHDLASRGFTVWNSDGTRRGRIGRVQWSPEAEPDRADHPALWALFAAFRSTQQELEAWGACDTEPDAVFEELIAAAMRGEEFWAPNAGGWMLYEESDDESLPRDAAGDRLDEAAKVVCELVANARGNPAVRGVVEGEL